MVFISRTTFFVIFTLTGSLWCLSLLPNSIVNNLLIILKPMTAITPLMTPCWTDTLLHCLVITLQRSSLHSTGTGFSHCSTAARLQHTLHDTTYLHDVVSDSDDPTARARRYSFIYSGQGGREPGVNGRRRRHGPVRWLAEWRTQWRTQWQLAPELVTTTQARSWRCGAFQMVSMTALSLGLIGHRWT